MRYLSEDALDYMNKIWDFRNSSYVDDFTMYWESDYPEMTAKLLVNAGAVEPNCKEAREIIKVAKSITRKEQSRILKKVLKNYKVVSCSNCNHVHFIPVYCNYKDWVTGVCDGCNKSGNLEK